METTVKDQEGTFFASLKRNNAKIREDRAIAIAEDAERLYKRKIEDLRDGIKKMTREREYMLDMSPTDSTSLVMASDFSADNFINKDLDLGLRIRNETIKLEIAEKSFKQLFGKEVA